MHNDNYFDLLIDVVFAMSPQLGVLGPKAQDVVISFFLGEEETLPDFHLRALKIRIELYFMQDQTGQSEASEANTSQNCQS